MAPFTPAFFTFLRALKRRNTREWFEANRERYVRDVEAPMLQFIDHVGPHLKKISRAYVADPRRTGGSMFRIYRDTRFSHDKTPYKTHVAARFSHVQHKIAPSVPGFYLHLEPGESYGGGGIYHPEPAALNRIRQAIAARDGGWAKVRRARLDIEGAVLTRGPAGFDSAHPFIDDLRRKDLYAVTTFTEAEACGADFLPRYVAACREVAPLVEFLTRALGLAW